MYKEKMVYTDVYGLELLKLGTTATVSNIPIPEHNFTKKVLTDNFNYTLTEYAEIGEVVFWECQKRIELR